MQTAKDVSRGDIETYSGEGMVAGAGIGLVLGAIFGQAGIGLIFGAGVGLELGPALVPRDGAGTKPQTDVDPT